MSPGGCPSSGIINNRKHDVSETGRISILRRRGGRDTYSVESIRDGSHVYTHEVKVLVGWEADEAVPSWAILRHLAPSSSVLKPQPPLAVKLQHVYAYGARCMEPLCSTYRTGSF
jgi:hypothetical protein